MRVRTITTCALGLAAALTLVASPSAAQDTTKLRKPSEQRINISKGEVVTPRADTVYVTRYDTVRVNNTIVRVDTVTVLVPPAPMIFKAKGSRYWGLYAGSSRPYGNIDRVYTNGFHGGGVLGWESQASTFGLRLDAGMTQIGREETLPATAAQIGSGTPLMMHFAVDGKAKALSFRGWDFYGLAGLNVNSYRGIALSSSNSKGPCGGTTGFTVRNECFSNAEAKWSSKFGFNFGVGTDFHIGSQDMFLEYRYIAARTNSSNSYVNPISLGVRFF